MKRFIKKKYEILLLQSGYEDTSVWLILFKKLGVVLVEVISFWVDILLFLLSSPALLFLVILLKKRNKKHSAFFMGLEHIVNKTVYRAQLLRKESIQSVFFALDSSVKSSFSDIIIHRYTKSIFINYILFLKQVYTHSPAYIEMYTEGNMYNHILVLYTAKFLDISTILIERGFLFQFNDNVFSKLFKIKLRLMYKISDKIYYRETYMPAIFKKIGIDINKLKFDFNRVPISQNYIPISQKKNIVLFLNGFKEWRNMDKVINAIPEVLKEKEDVFFQFVGADGQAKIDYYNALAKKLKIPESKYKIDMWTNTPKDYFDVAKIFVLPADLIFCNYSLLEAMEQGLVPVVANVEDTEKIVVHKNNGIVCERESGEIAKYLLELFKNERELALYSSNARNSIINNYNDEDRMEEIVSMVKKYKLN